MKSSIRINTAILHEVMRELDDWANECRDISIHVQTLEEEKSYRLRARRIDKLSSFIFRAVKAGEHGREIKGQI